MIRNGSLKIAHLAGVDVLIHWSWLLLLYISYNNFRDMYVNKNYLIIQLGLFMAMVLFSEIIHVIFGVLAQGTVSEIYVSFLSRSSNLAVPNRPTPTILAAAGAIIGYAALLGLTAAFWWFVTSRALGGVDLRALSNALLLINVVFLAWVLVPVYPQPGGQILRGLLWYAFGRIRSLQISCVLGLLGVIAILAIAYWLRSWWTALGAAFIAFACYNGFREAKYLGLLEKLPRRPDAACPHCKQHPFHGSDITCPCGQDFDPFTNRGQCPHCSSLITLIPCTFCGQKSPVSTWLGNLPAFEVQTPATTTSNPYDQSPK